MNEPRIENVQAISGEPLVLYEERQLGVLSMPDGATYHIQMGLNSRLAKELKIKSSDPADEALTTQTSDLQRFGQGSYEDWFAKGRYPFALIAPDGTLAAFIWFGQASLPQDALLEGDKWDTVAFRSYAPYRGKRLMTPFSLFALDAYRTLFPARRLWLQTNPDNAAGVALYTKLGFAAVPRTGSERLLMVQPT